MRQAHLRRLINRSVPGTFLIDTEGGEPIRLEPPPAAPTLVTQGTGLTGTYRYAYSFVGFNGVESEPSLVAQIVLANQGTTVTIPVPPAGFFAGVKTINIYRTAANATVLQLLTTLTPPNMTITVAQTFNDNTVDGSLGANIVYLASYPCPIDITLFQEIQFTLFTNILAANPTNEVRLEGTEDLVNWASLRGRDGTKGEYFNILADQKVFFPVQVGGIKKMRINMIDLTNTQLFVHFAGTYST